MRDDFYKLVRENYPRANKVLDKWMSKNALSHRRVLYDFFDAQGLLITCDYTGHWEYKFHNLGNPLENSVEATTREGAENKVFLLAFSKLEEHLKSS